MRLIAHTQQKLLRKRQKKAHIVEIQLNGGSVADKVDYAYGMFEKTIPIMDVFAKNEMIDLVGVTKGKGFKGKFESFARFQPLYIDDETPVISLYWIMTAKVE